MISTDMRNLLMIVHDFPPIHSTGATRPQKFADYLPGFGWQPHVLTTGRYGGLPTDSASHVHRADDLLHRLASLRRGRVPADAVPQAEQFRVATVANASTLGRMRDAILVPDTKLGWLWPAIRAGDQLVDAIRPDVLYSSSPPETAHLVARRLSRRHRLPWITDLRDGWLFEPPNPSLRAPHLRRRLEGGLEAGMMADAAAIVAATPPIAEDLRQRYPAHAAKVHVIPNGFDAAEFEGLRRERPQDGRFLVTYTGGLAASRQGTSADAFFDAVAALLAQTPDSPLYVRLVGNITAEERQAIAERGLSGRIAVEGQVGRHAAHQAQLDADALLLVTAPGQRSVATLKLYDYIGAGVPILALADDNAAATIVKGYDLGLVVSPTDPVAIAGALSELMQRNAAGTAWPGFAAARLRFERRRLAGELAELCDRVASSAH